ncbi:MAG: nucleoside kinase [Clostridia bacterium]
MSSFASGYIKYVNHLEQINDAALINPQKMIFEIEESYHSHIRSIARDIVSKKENIKICMLSGPSSSGKTTTAHLLQKELIKLGKNVYIVSMDNYFLNQELIPVLPNGKKDFENVKSLNLEQVEESLINITQNKAIKIPHFNFTVGRSVGEPKTLAIKENDIVIVEGIHALNPIFTKHIDSKKAIKLYVSAKQQIKDANGVTIEPFDLRLIRRIVRDMQFRGTSPEKTLDMWQGVLNGEDKYIRPYRLEADYTVNSVHIYEPCVLRTIAIPILRKIPQDSYYYRKARDLEARLMRFEPVDKSLVPLNSLIREFIGT